MFHTQWGYVMWACDACGCYGIATDLETCPHCGEERKMPKTTAGGGFTNKDAAPGEPGYITPAAADAAEAPQAAGPPAVNAPKADWVDHAVSQGADPDTAAAMTKAQLIEEHGNG